MDTMDTMARPGAGRDATDGGRHYRASLSRVTRHTASHEQHHYTPGDGGCVLVTNSLISSHCNVMCHVSAPHQYHGHYVITLITVIRRHGQPGIGNNRSLQENLREHTRCYVYMKSCFTINSSKLIFQIAILESH